MMIPNKTVCKVFCSECSNYSPWHRGGRGCDDHPESCLAPENHGDTYRYPKSRICNTPEEQNKKNDCSWFKVKKVPWWKLSWRYMIGREAVVDAP